jgi:hypothetical protein
LLKTTLWLETIAGLSIKWQQQLIKPSEKRQVSTSKTRTLILLCYKMSNIQQDHLDHLILKSKSGLTCTIYNLLILWADAFKETKRPTTGAW